MLCRDCTRLFSRLDATKPGQADEISHHYSAQIHKDASSQGCMGCEILCDQVRHGKTIVRWIRRKGLDYHLMIEMPNMKDSTSNDLPLYRLTRVVRHRDRLRKIPGYEQTASTGSEACFSLARHWMRTCLNEHTTCNRPRLEAEAQWKPLRLIKIDPQTNHLRLCEGDEFPPNVEYVTLSHCWGVIPDRIKLTKDNLPTFRKELPDLQQFQTFKDAIIVAKKLGIQYIWIDSLCISQHPPDDFKEEGQQMSSVYKYSRCNISATSARDDTRGCFFSRDAKRVLMKRIEIPRDSSRREKKYAMRSGFSVRRQPIIFDIDRYCEAEHWINDVEEGARCLSPRILHYTDNKIYWECKELIASECCPWGFPSIENQLDTRRVFPRLATNCLSKTALTSSEAQFKPDLLPLDIRSVFGASKYKTWMETVTSYSNGYLTYKEDKLRAISRLAKEVSNLHMCNYLAGLWKCNLLFELGWMTNGGSSPISEFIGDNQTYRAPSWSWASIDGPVKYPYHRNMGSGNIYPLVSINDFSQTIPDQYIDFSDIHLMVEAQLIMITVSKLFKEDKFFDRVTISGLNVTTEGNIGLDNDESGMAYLCGEAKRGLYLMPLVLFFFDDFGESHEEKFSFTGLLLEHDSGQSAYERVGALNWEGSKAILQQDAGLDLLLKKVGTIDWRSGSRAQFQYNRAELERIKLI
ncbi:hypothetical protein B7463_g11394, partial [Scytalidium lignicola]